MENNTEKTIDKLNHLIEIATDGNYGYKNASEDVEDVTLKQLFIQYSAERRIYAEQLQDAVKSLGGSPDNNGGPMGAMHRTWMDIKSTVTSGDRETVLNTCVTGEEAAIKAYRETLEANDLKSAVRQLIIMQLSGIEAALNSVRSLLSVVRT